MTILKVSSIAKYFGAECLFSEVSFIIGRGEKVALVGRNGEGKTTLFRAIAGQAEYDAGSIEAIGNARIGYLQQDVAFTTDGTLYQEVETVFASQRELEEELRQLEAAMSRSEVYNDPERMEKAMAEYARLTAEFEARGGYGYPTLIKTTLFGLGFDESDLTLPMAALSGGQRVRTALAKLLLIGFDLLLLDEPTNHLDIAATEWLEGYLKAYPGAVLIVSHDRYFLDAVCTKVVELENGTASSYTGNYSSYIAQKELKLRLQGKEYKRQQEEMERLREFIRRFRGNFNLRRQVADREKKLARLEAVAVDRPRRAQNVKLSFDIDQRGGDEVLRLRGLSKAYGDNTLFRDFTTVLFRGERVALVGPNGSGKTTFIKVLLGQSEPSAGSFEWGANLTIGYFSQELCALDDSKTLVEEIMEEGDFLPGEARSILGRFLFSGEDAFKPVSILSGGERNRLIMAKLVISRANVLVLDEPTNHLDIQAKQVLEEALGEYPGTIIFVSHDRYFIDQLATRVYDFSEETIVEYEGNYSMYRAQREYRRSQAAPTSEPVQRVRRNRTAQTARVVAPGREAIRALEEEIQSLEQKKKMMEMAMATEETYKTGQAVEIVAEYRALTSRLDGLYQKWEEWVEAGFIG